MIETFLPFLAGSLAFLSPCIVPMLTVYFSLITGMSAEELLSDYDTVAIRKNIISRTLLFIAGYTLIFTLVGAAAGFFGSLLNQKFFFYFNIVDGAILIILGLSLMGLFKLPGFRHIKINVSKIFRKKDKPLTPLGAFFVGIVYALACSHCIGSLLVGMLVYAGSKGTSGGAFALFLFSLGLAIPYLITALAISSVVDYLKKIKRRIWIIQLISGLIIIIFGILVLTNNFGALSSFFTRILPYKFPGM